MEPEVSDVSNKTIVVLVVLTVIISVLSTLVVLNEVQNFKAPARTVSQGAQQTNSAQGIVSLEILPDKPSVTTTGYVTFNIEG